MHRHFHTSKGNQSHPKNPQDDDEQADDDFMFNFSSESDVDDDDEITRQAKRANNPNLLLEDLEAKRNEEFKKKYIFLEKFTRTPFKYAIVRETVQSIAGPVLNSGDIVIVDWLGSGHFEVNVYPVWYFGTSIDISQENLSNISKDIHQFTLDEKIIPNGPKDLVIPRRLNLFQIWKDLDEKWLFLPELSPDSPSLTFKPTLSPQFISQTELNLIQVINGKDQPCMIVFDSNCEKGSVHPQNYSQSALKVIKKARTDLFFDLDPIIIDPITIGIRNLTFISPQQSIQELKRVENSSLKIDQNITYTPRHTEFVFELYPFLSVMPHPVTHPFPISKKLPNKEKGKEPKDSTTSYPSLPTDPTYPRHYASAPLTVDTSLASWCWPVHHDYFKNEIFSKKCFVIHCGGSRLSTVRRDLSNFNVKSLIHASPSTIIWMKSLPKLHPNIPLGELYNQRTMQYIATGPETAFSAYLSGHTIYFNPIDQIQAKYVKSLTQQLGHGYGYVPCSINYENDDEMGHLDQSGNFGGDMEIFAVNSKHVTDWHLDAQDNISIQLVGTKRWFVVPGLDQPITNYHPRSTNKESVCADQYMHQLSNLNHSGPNKLFGNVGLNNARSNTNQEEHSMNWANLDHHPKMESFIARPGTIFYHPAGTYHKVEALDSDGSLSLNISMDCLRYSDLIMATLSQMIMTQPQLRQRVNIDRDNIENVMKNAMMDVLPQLLGDLNKVSADGNRSQGDNSDQQNQSSPPTNTPSRTGLIIPALFTNAQIHDYPLGVILSSPAHPLYSPLSTLLFKDNGCINLMKHLYLPTELIGKYIFHQRNSQNGNKLGLFLESLLRCSPYVQLYYPELSSFIQSIFLDYSDTNDDDRNGGETNNKVNENNINEEFDRQITKINFVKNTLVSMLSNQPQYIINTLNDKNNIPKLQKSSELAPISTPIWPSQTISKIEQIENDHFYQNLVQKLTQIIQRNNTDPHKDHFYDLSTLPLLFSGKRFDASYHLYSICSGFSTHSTTSNITPNAQNTKIAPQYSIGIILDSSKCVFGSQQGKSIPHPKETNHIFSNILTFLHWVLQQSIPIDSFYELNQLAINIALIGSDRNAHHSLNAGELICIKMLVINFVSLYTHCGIFIPR
jgi:hypothetical protein